MKNPKTTQEKSLKYRSFEVTYKQSLKPSLKAEAFRLAYKEAALPLMKFLVKRMGGNVEAAEEVFQETALAALKGWYTFEHKSSYFTWICRIGLNKMADYYRHQINHESRIIAPLFEELSQFHTSELSNEEKLSLLELRESVKDCLLLLPDEKRQLLYMRYWLDMSILAIAQNLGISERAAEGKVYRAKVAFREVYILQNRLK